jgi:eukaryotic-like serine/threonine-protein kinase
MSNRLSQIEQVFHAVLEVPAAERAAYLTRACGDDPALWAEVTSLISSFESSNGFMEQPALDLGIRVLSQDSAVSLVGKTIKSYRIISPLGKGGMGEVYLAEDTRLGRRVALKFLSNELVGDEWAKRQLVNEAKAVARLDHPNICPVYGIEEDEDHRFIVMQYVEGRTLSVLIRERSLDPQQILPVAQQIAGALAEAHQHGIIHRDIKPGNIIITPSRQAKVLDFGLAKFIRSEGVNDDTESIPSRTGLLAGTVSYMSPEQLRGQALDGRSDIFSFGILLHELLAGRNPFACSSQAETISAILSNTPASLARLPPQIPRNLGSIVSKCLQKQPSDRYRSAAELLPDLVRVRDFGNPWWQTRTMRFLYAAILAAALISLGLWTFWKTYHDRAESLAVLPVVNATTGSEIDYLTDGLTAELISRLSNRTALHVKPLTSVWSYKDQKINPQEAGRALNVEAVLMSRVIKPIDAGQKIQVWLVRTSDGQEIWRGEYEFGLQTLTSIERNISENVTSSLGVNLERVGAHSPDWNPKPEALQNYLYGKSLMQERDVDNIRRAINFFQTAVNIDPAFAKAHAALAEAWISLPSPAYGSLRTQDVMYQARAEAVKALEIDPNLSEAHTSLAVFKLKFEWEWKQAEDELLLALKQNPDYAMAHYWYSQLLIITGRFPEALSESERAQELDPSSSIINVNVGRSLFFARDYTRAIEHLTTILNNNARDTRARYVLGYVYQQVGMYEEALKIFKEGYSTDRILWAAPLGFTYGRMGRTQEAGRILDELEELSQKKNVHPHEKALIYIGLKDFDNSFKFLEQSYQERFHSIPYLASEPIYDDLRNDPRYSDLVRRLNLLQDDNKVH